MSLIIIGKVSLASLGAGAVAVGGFLLHKLLNPTVEIYGFVETTDSSKPPITGTLKCSITGSSKKIGCKVEEVTQLTSESKNHVFLSKFKTSHKSQPIASDAKLTSEKLYQITVAASELPASTIKSIEVFEGPEHKISIGTINTLFQIKDGSSTNVETWKTKYFVGQASSVPKDLKDISGYKCSWQKDSTARKDCTIKPFVKDDSSAGENAKIESLAFTKTTDAISSIKEHHFYLIEFTSDDGSKELKDFVETDLIYAKDATTSGTEKITFSTISAVKVVGEQLLILKESASISN